MESACATPTITVTIENQHPVELIDFTRSLLALGDEFRREVEAKAEGFDGKLYVKELRNGSLVAELMVIAPAVGAALEAVNLTHDFFGNLKATIDWLKGLAEKPERMEAKTVANISTLLEPVAKDNGSNCSIVVHVQGDVNAPLTINAAEANGAQNRAERYLKLERAAATEIHRGVIMGWAVVKNETGTPATGEKAIIDKLSDRPLKVVFDSRALREEMLQGHANPLREAFVVDVETQTVRGKLAAYKILQMHERFRVDEDEPPPRVEN